MNPDEYRVMRQQEDTHWWYRALRSAVLRHLRARLGERSQSPRILDAGCGTGGMLAALRESFPHAELTGVDIEELAVEITAARHVANHVIRASVNAFRRAPIPLMLRFSWMSCVTLEWRKGPRVGDLEVLQNRAHRIPALKPC